jgi:hypothetical protein
MKVKSHVLCECHNPTGELCSKWLEIATAAQKINVDNKANFRYPDDYSFCLMEASICWVALSHRSS